MSNALTSLPFKASVFSLVSAVFGAGIVAIAELVPTPKDPFGGAPVFEVTLYQDAGNGQFSVATPPGAQPPTPQPRKLQGNQTETQSAIAVVSAPIEPVTIRQVNIQPFSLAALPHNAAPLPVPSSSSSGEENSTPQTSTAARKASGDNRNGSNNSGARNATSVDEYEATVIRWIERHKRHPGKMRGIVTLAFSVDRRGRMRDCRIISTSGDTRLDQTAVAQVNAAAPFPRPSHDVTWQTRQMQVRLDYRST